MGHTRKLPIVVLISGSGSNLQALIDGAENGTLPIEIKAVISNKEDAYGLIRAEKAHIETQVLDHKNYPDRESYDLALADLIEGYQPGLVILAGFMRILTPDLVNRFAGKMLNIHPSLLPKYRGLHTHKRALEAGDRMHGASVHFVTEELDGGPVVLQALVPVEAGDDEESLAARVLTREHVIYPTVVRWFAENRISINDNKVAFDGLRLDKPILLDFEGHPPQ